MGPPGASFAAASLYTERVAVLAKVNPRLIFDGVLLRIAPTKND